MSVAPSSIDDPAAGVTPVAAPLVTLAGAVPELPAHDLRLVPLELTSAPPVATWLVLVWRRIALGLILVLSACLEFIGLGQEGYANTYYAAGVKSMLTSWHNFFFVSFDSGGFVSLDKPPLGLWIEAASAKLFGFSGISLLAPEALAGVLSVALLYHLVSRAHGAVAGLLAALILAVTPISAIVDRNNTIDSLLILSLLLGGWALVVATERACVRWLLLAAVAVGLGFNIKMLQAYLVVPAFALVYLLGTRLSWRERFAHLLLAGVVLLVVAFSWVAIVDLTPAAQRPFVSDSGTNSELSLVFGYNGLGRLVQAIFPGLTHLSIFGDPIDLTIEPGMSPGIGNPGVFRLVSAALGGQASWFLLPALAGLAAAARLRRPRLPLDRRGQSLLLWGVWLLVAALFFSTARFFHFYYLVMLAPPIAALAGAAMVTLWREYRRPAATWRQANWRAWLLPATLVGTALLQVRFLDGYPDWSGSLGVLTVGGCILAAVVLTIMRLGLVERLRPRETRITPAVALAGLLLGVSTLFAAPTTWAIASIAGGAGGTWLPQAGVGMGFGGGPRGGPGGFGFGRQGGSPFGGTASGSAGAGGGAFGGGPTVQAGGGPGGATFGGQGSAAAGGGPFGGPGAGGMGGSGAMTFAGGNVPALDASLLRYLEHHQGKARYLVATTTSSYASLFILQTGQPAMALGGYQGWDRILTLSQLKQMITAGTVRFFYLPAAGSGTGSQPQPSVSTAQGTTTRSASSPSTGQAASQNLSATNDGLTNWVQSACTAVPSTLWRSRSTSAASNTPGGGPGGALQLYDCAGRG